MLAGLILVSLGFIAANFSSGPPRLDSIETSVPDASPENSRLVRTTESLLANHQGESGFYALPNGVDAMAARIRLIDAADVTLDIQYYIWHHDLAGRGVYQRLLRAADRGVSVRILLDDLDTSGKDAALLKIDAHPNVDIRVFNPFAHRNVRWLEFPMRFGTLNHRMHNKSLTADRSATIVGGRNIGNEYLGAETIVGFSDMDVLSIGKVAVDVSESFDLYWNSRWAYPLRQLAGKAETSEEAVAAFRYQLDEYLRQNLEGPYASAVQQAENKLFSDMSAGDFSWGNGILVYDDPEKVTAAKRDASILLAPNLLRAIEATQEDLIIISPYFVPGDRFTEYLVELVKKGVRVRIMTNSLAANDVALVHAGYRRYREALISGGVELYEFKPVISSREIGQPDEAEQRKWTGASRASLHGKYFAFDRQHVFIGSFNMDGRSVSLNTELGVYFESESYADYLYTHFDEIAFEYGYRVTWHNDALQWQTLEDGQLVTYKVEPETSWVKRTTNTFFSWFVPERQL